MICEGCNKNNNDYNLFCLGCGKLLRDYSIKPSNLDYSGDDEDLLAQVAVEFVKTMGQYENLMGDFSEGLDKSSLKLKSIVEKSDKFQITPIEFEVKSMEIFNDLSDLFENNLVSIQDVSFELLQYSNIIFEIVAKFKEDISKLDESHSNLIRSIESMIETSKMSTESLLSISFENSTLEFENSKARLSKAIDEFVVFNESLSRELKYIKDKHKNSNCMSQDNKNHFCIYCGEKLDPGQNFCSQCGREIYHEKPVVMPVSSKYDERIADIEQEYNLKQQRARELVEKVFDPTHMAYNKFSSSIDRSNQLFNNQLEVTRKMVELDTDNNELVEKEIDNKVKTLEAFIDKMEDLINELVIHLSSNKKDNDDINNLFNDMDDLIRSVKDY